MNGIDTTFMNERDLKYAFVSNNTSIDCVFADEVGREIKTTLKPILKSAPKSNTDYVSLLKNTTFHKNSKYYIQTDANEAIFQPLVEK